MSLIIFPKPGQKWSSPLLKSPLLVAHLAPESIRRDYSALYATASSPGSAIPHRQYQRGSDYTASFMLRFDDYSDPDVIITSRGTIQPMTCQQSIDWLHTVSLPVAFHLADVGVESEPPVLLMIWGTRPIIEVDLTLGPVVELKSHPTTKQPIQATVEITLTRVLPVAIRYREVT